MKRYIPILAAFFFSQIIVVAQNAKPGTSMKSFIDGLMKKMTLEEKLGQLNLPGAGDIVTGGQAGQDNSALAKKIKEGKVGGLFNIKGVDKIRYVQQIAMEQS